jgi:hypothetical protein
MRQDLSWALYWEENSAVYLARSLGAAPGESMGKELGSVLGDTLNVASEPDHLLQSEMYWTGNWYRYKDMY